MLGITHVIFAIAALIFGAVVACRPKGNRKHRITGYFYAISLLLVNVSALSVYEDLPVMGPFHVLALVSLLTLTAGLTPAVLRWPVSWWLGLHGYFMSWSYVGLVAAGVAQLVTMSSGLPAWLTVGLTSGLVVVIGGALIHARVPRILANLD